MSREENIKHSSRFTLKCKDFGSIFIYSSFIKFHSVYSPFEYIVEIFIYFDSLTHN